MTVVGRPAPVERARFVKRERRPRHVWPRAESTALFAAAFACYTLLGWRVTLQLHVIDGDAMSRLTHAYDVFWNSPPKLAALGLVWPPLMSAVFLPFALVKPLADTGQVKMD